MLRRKDKILISAISLLDSNGVSGITTKNLALDQNITEPALYRQYKGKQDILDSIVDEYVSYDRKILNTIKESNMTGKQAIIFYAKRFSELYQNYSELTTVMFSMDLFQYNQKTQLIMKKATQERLDLLTVLFSQLGEEVDAKELASLLNGIIVSQAYEWRLMNKNYSLEERIMSFIEKLLSYV